MTLFRPAMAYALAIALLAGCAGYRGGWKSVAYVGDAAPAPEAAALDARDDRPTLQLSGLSLQVELDNQLRTYDRQVALFAVPVSVDPRKAYPKNVAPGKTRVFVTVTPAEAGFEFHPTQAVLAVGAAQAKGVAGYEFGLWDAQGQRVAEGGTWDHRPVGPDFVLTEPGRRYYLSIDFATPTPNPEAADITLDLSRALVSPRRPSLPLIRFMPKRWKEGYS